MFATTRFTVSDLFSKKVRSYVMSRVRSAGNERTELALARFFRKHKYNGWRRHQKLFGKPDFVFREVRLAVFVDGCFWHGCPRHGTLPASNAGFWRQKLSRNRARDRLVISKLRSKGWTVLRIWQHELLPKNERRLHRRVKSTMDALAQTRGGFFARSFSLTPICFHGRLHSLPCLQKAFPLAFTFPD